MMGHKAKRGSSKILLFLSALACSGESPAGPDVSAGFSAPPGLRVSDSHASVGASTSLGAERDETSVAYVSAEPGTLSGATGVEIRNRTREAVPRNVAVLEGGFDPVRVQAQAGDELILLVAGSLTETTLAIKVPPRRQPTVVRTRPSKGRTDVALNERIIVVFSEPLDKASVSASSLLLVHDLAQVPGTVRLSDDGLNVEFVPATSLEPLSNYSLRISEALRDTDGEALGEPVIVDFGTAADGLTGEIIFSQWLDGQIYRMKADGSGGAIRLTSTRRNLRPVWSPDGSTVAFIINTAGPENNGFGQADVYTMNADGADVVRRTVSGNIWFAAWSPDGRKLVVSTEMIYQSEAYVVDLDAPPGSAPKHLASMAGSPAWSPDGKQIVFVRLSGDDGYHQLYTINADGTGARALTEIDPGAIYRPSWSPDGSRIAFSKCNQARCDINVMNADGSGSTKVTDIGIAQEAAWSPDGKWLVLSLWRYNGMQTAVTLGAVAATGGQVREFTPGGFHPSWRP